MHIDAYSFGKIVVDGTAYTSDLVIYPDHVEPDWRRNHGHHLEPDDLAGVITAAPRYLVIGTGAHGRMTVSFEARRLLRRTGISFDVLPTDRACRAFNQHSGAAAALHLTC